MKGRLLVQRKTTARIPTPYGEFSLHLYHNSSDDKEHLALTLGDVHNANNLLTRLHSECFTGDVLGSLRCDCGDQLNQALEKIAAAGRGALLYLRQEGRGIGLLDKLQAYNLQDQGLDTVDANLALGHQADPRDYQIAAGILRDLAVSSVQLLTNNPRKIEQLETLGIDVAKRVALLPAITPENAAYLSIKMKKLRHLFQIEELPASASNLNGAAPKSFPPGGSRPNRPFVTLSYAQSLNGMIAKQQGKPTPISGKSSMRMTHQLRAEHDAILIGIGSALSDDPRLTVRLAAGDDPQPVILDSHLRFPETARLWHGKFAPWILTTFAAPQQREEALQALGGRIVRLPATAANKVDLTAGLAWLKEKGVETLMVEGGADVIANFLRESLVDRLIVTISPFLMGGLNAAANLTQPIPPLTNMGSVWLDDDLIIWGDMQQKFA